MPARQRDPQELCPSRNRWKTQIVHVVTVVQVADFQRRHGNGFSPMQVRQAIGPRHGNSDFVLSPTPKPTRCSRGPAARASNYQWREGDRAVSRETRAEGSFDDAFV
jgi:hypothetical protein